jgi:Dolichyl-phosphate-mannose-protein mannosyltransferase
MSRTAWTHGCVVVACVGVIYAVWISTVPPQGEFPLNDDWAYAWSVRRFLESGQVRLSDWSSATVVLQIYWGAAASKIAGAFSFTALRWSTLVMSFVGCIGLYGLLRQLGIVRSSALFGAIALACNPLYLYLSFTFMSDVYFLAPMILSLALYTRGLQSKSPGALVAGSFFAAVAYLARQLGLALPIAALSVLVTQRRALTLRRDVLSVALVPLVVVVAHVLWLRGVHGLPWAFEVHAVDNSLKALLTAGKPFDLAWRGCVALMYLGVLTMPVMAAVFLSYPRDDDRFASLFRLFRLWLLPLGILVLAMTAMIGRPMPYLGNALNREGIGTVTLLGAKEPVTPSWVFWLITAVAPIFGAAQGALWTGWIINARRRSDLGANVLLVASLLMAALMAVIVVLWDEYLIVLVPAALFLALGICQLTRTGLVAGLVLCSLMLLYGLREMADHMAWNRARWMAGKRLVAEGVPPERIDGGFEWVGWYEFDSGLAAARAGGHHPDLFEWMKVTPDCYVLAFSPLAGYAELGSTPYSAWPRAAHGRIYALRSPVNCR